METKINEWRPVCHTRLGDVVDIDGKRYLKIKCRRCSKSTSKDVFHYLRLDDAVGVV